MAEQEIVKHTKKIFGIWTTKSSFLHKLSEFITEILIIVFAISLSIYFHDRSELRHQRRDVKEFLLGLRQDLNSDVVEMNDDKQSYQKNGFIFKYIVDRKLNEPLNLDTIRKYSNWIFNSTGLTPNDGRFEGFKSSGKIGNIENKELQDHIMDLYQEDIPSLTASTNSYISRKQKLFDYIFVNLKRTGDTTSNLLPLLSANEGFGLCASLTFVQEILDRYDSCINKIHLIVGEIDKDYSR